MDLSLMFRTYKDIKLTEDVVSKINFKNMPFYRRISDLQDAQVCRNGSTFKSWNNTNIYYQYSNIEEIMRNPTKKSKKVGF